MTKNASDIWREDVGDCSYSQVPMPIWYHDIYTTGIHRDSRFPRERYRMLKDRIQNSQNSGLIEFMSPECASKEDLLTSHDPDFIRRFLDGELGEKEVNRIGLKPWTDSFVERTLRIMGGSLSALKRVCEFGGISGNMAGGTHHSHAGFGAGYCVFNDIAVCAVKATESLGIARVAILDLDVHQGDGTATMLKDIEGALTISVHCKDNFPFRKAISDHDFPLNSGVGDVGYLEKVSECLEILEDYDPDLLLFQAGVDSLEKDGLGKMNVTRGGMRARNRMVFSYLVEKSLPCVIFMGGGYAKPISHTIDAFYDLFIDGAVANSYIQRGNKSKSRKQATGGV